MDDPLLVSGGKALSNLHGVRDCRTDRKGAAIEHLAQRSAFHRLGDDIRRLRIGADVVDGQYVGIRELGCRVRVLLESPQAIGIGCEVGPQHPEGDVALLVVIARVIHLAESGQITRGKDLVGAEASPGCKRHDGHILPSTGHWT